MKDRLDFCGIPIDRLGSRRVLGDSFDRFRSPCGIRAMLLSPDTNEPSPATPRLAD